MTWAKNAASNCLREWDVSHFLGTVVLVERDVSAFCDR